MKGVHPMETLRFSNFLDPYIQTMPDSMQDGMLYRLTYAENLTRLTFYVTFPQTAFLTMHRFSKTGNAGQLP